MKQALISCALCALSWVPGPALGQVEAEPGTAERADAAYPHLPLFDIAASLRGTYRLPPSALSPRYGFALALSGEIRYFTLARRLPLGLQADLGYARHARAVTGSRPRPDGGEETFPGHRIIADNQFCLLQTLGIVLRPTRTTLARTWLGLGGGLALGDFYSDERALRPGTAHPLRPFARATTAVELSVRGNTFVALRLDYSRMAKDRFLPAGAAPGADLLLFGDLLTLGLAVGTRIE